jgi:hypothetical protein
MENHIPRATDRRSDKRNRTEKTPSIRAVPSSGDTYSPDELEFMLAMDRYKRDNRRPFPSWSEVLGVVRALGYRKV